MLNPTQFHDASGSGYDFLGEVVIGLDASNPQLAARLATSFGSWRMMDEPRRTKAEQALRRVAGKDSLSRDVGDIIQRSLAV
jgi:aminopeptidase N